MKITPFLRRLAITQVSVMVSDRYQDYQDSVIDIISCFQRLQIMPFSGKLLKAGLGRLTSKREELYRRIVQVTKYFVAVVGILTILTFFDLVIGDRDPSKSAGEWRLFSGLLLVLIICFVLIRVFRKRILTLLVSKTWTVYPNDLDGLPGRAAREIVSIHGRAPGVKFQIRSFGRHHFLFANAAPHCSYCFLYWRARFLLPPVFI